MIKGTILMTHLSTVSRKYFLMTQNNISLSFYDTIITVVKSFGLHQRKNLKDASQIYYQKIITNII